MALTRNKGRTYDLHPVAFAAYPVQNAQKIFEGSALGYQGATTPDSVRTADGALAFAGFADREADNSLGATGDIKVRARVRGCVTLPVTGVTLDTAPAVTVFASDDDTFKLTSTGAVSIGKVKEVVGVGVCKVEFEATAVRSI